MGNPTRIATRVEVATQHDTQDIRALYAAARIEPEVLRGLADPSSKVRAAAGERILGFGGFLSSHDEKDMELGLRRGVTVVARDGGDLVGFNRHCTDGRAVHDAFCAEFHLDVLKPQPAGGLMGRLTNGLAKARTHRRPTRVEWTDRETARIAHEAALAGRRGDDSGTLVWALDTAVRSDRRRTGVGAAMAADLRARHIEAGRGWVAYRVFELRAVNRVPVDIHNQGSERAFVRNTTRLFAYVDERLCLHDGIDVDVRWHFWLSPYAGR